jgi:pimeloyl-ACP methyl ester carboxylesterase
MEHLMFDDVELDHQVRGDGEPVVFVHASAFVSWFEPLVERLKDRATLCYRRRLRRRDDGTYSPLTIAEDAATCARLMDHVGWQTAHVVGHSYGALVALQLGLDAPRRVRSIGVLEPAASGLSPSIAAATAPGMQPVVAAYQAGDSAAAVDGFLRQVCGDGYRPVLDRALPGAFDEAVGEADLFFRAELGAIRQWQFGPDEAARVRQPVLDVLGTGSAPRFVAGSELVRSWFPEAEHLEIPEVRHLLMVEDPVTVADGLRDFFDRHRHVAH